MNTLINYTHVTNLIFVRKYKYHVFPQKFRTLIFTMARRRYRRRYYKKTRWSANLTNIIGNVITAEPSTSFQNNIVLCYNPIQSQQTVSQKFTVKNVEFNGVYEAGSSSATTIENFCAYIMFVPQGMNVTANYETQHPEYIMAMKYFGSPSNDGQQQYQPFKVRTRLARTLDTGDSVILYLKGTNVGTTQVNLEYSGVVRWWTKAN